MKLLGVADLAKRWNYTKQKELLDADYKYWHTHIKWTFKK